MISPCLMYKLKERPNKIKKKERHLCKVSNIWWNLLQFFNKQKKKVKELMKIIFSHYLIIFLSIKHLYYAGWGWPDDK